LERLGKRIPIPTPVRRGILCYANRNRAIAPAHSSERISGTQHEELLRGKHNQKDLRLRRRTVDLAGSRVSAGKSFDVEWIHWCVPAAVAGIRAYERNQGRDWVGFVAGKRPASDWRSAARGVPAGDPVRTHQLRETFPRKDHHIAGTDVPLGVAVRAGTPRPNVSTVDAFRQALLKSKCDGTVIGARAAIACVPNAACISGNGAGPCSLDGLS
jgi:hypothetical protein